MVTALPYECMIVNPKRPGLYFFLGGGVKLKIQKKTKTTLSGKKKNINSATLLFMLVDASLPKRALSWIISPWTRGSGAAITSTFWIPDQERRIRGALQLFNLQSSLKKTRREILLPHKGAYFRSRAENSHQQQRTIDALAVSRRATNFSSSATRRQHQGAQVWSIPGMPGFISPTASFYIAMGALNAMRMSPKIGMVCNAEVVM
jgi:hypothetical protein